MAKVKIVWLSKDTFYDSDDNYNIIHKLVDWSDGWVEVDNDSLAKLRSPSNLHHIKNLRSDLLSPMLLIERDAVETSAIIDTALDHIAVDDKKREAARAKVKARTEKIAETKRLKKAEAQIQKEKNERKEFERLQKKFAQENLKD